MARTVKEAAILALQLLEDEEDGWIGVDLDGTLAKHSGWKGATHIGEPIPKMVARVRRWVGHGKKVKIFTARADDERAVNAIKKWLKKHELPDLEVTNLKDPKMTEFWDDKAVAVEKNTGEVKEAESPKNFLRRVAPVLRQQQRLHSEFQTSDGYRLKFEPEYNVWSDGEMDFDDENGHPVDSHGQPLEGQFL